MGLPAEARKMGAQPRWTGYVGVDDVDAATDRLKRLGGAVYVPPTDVPDVSRFSVVADPQAATLALVKWLNPGQEQPVAPTSLGHVGWHALSAVDWQKAFAFYGELFGWQKVDADVVGIGTYQLFSAAGQTIGSMSTKPPAVPMPFWLYYFNVGDIDAAVERVKAPGDKRIARCTDPQDAMFALTGSGRSKTIGYFGPVAADDPAATRLFVPKKLLGALGIDRLNAQAALLQIFRRHLQWDAQRRPIAGGGVDGRLPFRHAVAAVDQPLYGLVDHVGWKSFC
jgi:hypothetical protein